MSARRSFQAGRRSHCRTLAVLLTCGALIVGADPAAASRVHPSASWSPGPVRMTTATPVHAIHGAKPAPRRARSPFRAAPVVWPAAHLTHYDLPATDVAARHVPSGDGSADPRISSARVSTAQAAAADTGSVLSVARAGTFTPRSGLGHLAQAARVRAGSAAAPRWVSVFTRSHALARQAGISGVVASISVPGSARPSAISLSLNYASFADAYGGDFGSRLRLVELPGCVLTTPARAACRVQTPIPDAVNDVAGNSLVADVLLPAAPGTTPANTSDTSQSSSRDAARPSTAAQAAPSRVVIAATSSTASDGGGTYSATSLRASGSWSVTNTGAYTYSYPITAPPSVGGAAPSVALSYNSAAVDGLTSTTNSQSSWIGDGWDYSPGFIERSYKTCNDDGTSGSYDECWAGDNATLSFNGISSQLVPDGTANQWRLSNDDGALVNELSGASNGLNAGTYWQLITQDGTQYFFGADHLPSSVGGDGSDTSTQSAWGLPVFGNNSGEPCYNAAFTQASCTQGWRWNLDFTIDPHHNLTTYSYQPEINHYQAGVDTAISGDNGTLSAYTRGGVLTSIRYGQNVSSYLAGNQAGARIQFATDERCNPSGGYDCTQPVSAISASNASHYPDVPYDLYCAGTGTCTVTAPSFWSELALSSITTQVWNEGLSTPGWSTVDTYALAAPDFPAPGDAGQSGGPATPALWLDSITHTGSDTYGGGSAASLAAITFNGSFFPNRAFYPNMPSNVTMINRERLTSITTGTGSQITIAYNTSEPCKSATPTPDADTTSCFPVIWTPDNGASGPINDWFQTYPVAEVQVSDNTAVWGTGSASPTQYTDYSYSNPAWHRDDSPFTPDSLRTWGQFRGYAQLTTTTGHTPDPITETVTDYLQGMSGDYKYANGTWTNPSRSVTTLENTSITDANALAGYVYQSITYAASGGAAQIETTNTPWLSPTTADQSQPNGGGNPLPDLTAQYTGTSQSDTLQLLASGSWRTSRVATAYNNTTGLISTVDDLGQITGSGTPGGATTPERCTTTSYASAPAGTNMLAYPDETVTNQGSCSATPNATTLSAATTYYGSNTLGTLIAPGDITSTQALQTASGSGGSWAPPKTMTYDSYGRPLSTSQTINSATRATTVNYGSGTQANYLPITVTTTTNPATENWTSSTTIDPGRGETLTSTDTNGNLTTEHYDGLGRLIAVWLPNHPQASNPNAPSEQFKYTIGPSAAVAVESDTLTDGSVDNVKIQIYDALLQLRQTQSTALNALNDTRDITDTGYDSHGWATSSDEYYDNTANPSTTPVTANLAAIPTETRTSYDGRGRALIQGTYDNNVLQWQSSTSYPGADQTTTTPPTGATPTTTYTDSRGQTTELADLNAGSNYADTYYSYDALGRRTSLIGPISPATSPSSASSLTWTTSYDALGDTTTAHDPDTGTTTSTYDGAGDLLGTTDQAGQLLSYSYDDLARETAVYNGPISTGKLISSWTYDTAPGGLGQPASATQYAANGNTATWQQSITGYTPMGNTTGQTTTIPAGTYGNASAISQSTTNTYTAIQNLLYEQVITDSGTNGLLTNETMGWGYYSTGQPSGSGGTAAYVTNETYDAWGNPLRTAMGARPKQLVQTYNWDSATNRLIGTTTSLETSTTGTYDDTEYTYNPAGEITSANDTRRAVNASTTTSDLQCYTYDPLQRLSNVWTDKGGTTLATTSPDAGQVGTCTNSKTNNAPTGTTAIGGLAPYWEQFSYDLTGNRTSFTETAVPSGASSTTTTSNTYTTSGSTHALTTSTTGSTALAYTYTGDGQTQGATTTTSGTLNTAATQTYTWTPTGQLQSLLTGPSGAPTKTSTYTYDPTGNLAAETDNGTTTLYLGSDTLTLTNGTVTQAVRTYTQTGAPTVARIATTSSNVVHYQVTNTQDTGLIDTTADLATITRRAYTPFGQPRTAASSGTTWAGTHGFVNGTTSTATTLTNLGAREYNPTQGRFISVDPLLETNDPQAINGYTYADNNPTNNTDPTGLYIPGDNNQPIVGTSAGDNQARNNADPAPNFGSATSYGSGGQYSVPAPPSTGGTYFSGGSHTGSSSGPVLLCGAAACQTQQQIDAAQRSGVPDPEAEAAPGPGYVTSPYTRPCGAEIVLICIALSPVVDVARCAAHPGLTAACGQALLSGGIAACAAATDGLCGAAEGEEAGDAAADTADGAGDLASSCANSFTGDTPVTLAGGKQEAISQVKVGDKVIATDPYTGQTKAEPVVALIRHKGQHSMVLITLSDGSVLDATSGHKIWDATQQTFDDASELHAGDKIETDTGDLITIASLSAYSANLTAYNLQIDQIHTYYVGTTPVLVHNSCEDYIADNIAQHAEHSIPGVPDDELPDYVRGVMDRSPGYTLRGGRTGWWDPDKGAVVIRQGNSGTVFVPSGGYGYFLRQVAD